jgi:XTP/dITP diphosphohydrolase
MDILLASNNKNKYIELQNIFKNSNSKCNLISSEDIPNVLEDRKSIEENAQKKAEECYKKFKIPVIADDSGLFVRALNEKPGVHSKRYAGKNATDLDNIKKIILDLQNKLDLFAIFKTVLCFFDGEKFIFSKGVLNGTIVLSPRGSNGFGYDSIFEVDGKTLAEMTLTEKSQISHRKLATVKLVNELNEI